MSGGSAFGLAGPLTRAFGGPHRPCPAEEGVKACSRAGAVPTAQREAPAERRGRGGAGGAGERLQPGRGVLPRHLGPADGPPGGAGAAVRALEDAFLPLASGWGGVGGLPCLPQATPGGPESGSCGGWAAHRVPTPFLSCSVLPPGGSLRDLHVGAGAATGPTGPSLVGFHTTETT